MSDSKTSERGLATDIGRIAGMIGSDNFPTGERAALRRMRSGSPLPLAFYRFALNHLPPGWERNTEDWVTLVAGIAIMSPGAHQPQQSLGRSLAETGYAEARLERLLLTTSNTRRTLLLRAARFLSAKGTPFDWTQAALLLLISDDQNKRESLHRRIATDFYYALGR